MVKYIVVKDESLVERFMVLKAKLALKHRKDYSDESVLREMVTHVEDGY